MASAKLLHLVGALISDEEVRRKFNEAPSRVMRQYKLDDDDKAVLWTMTPSKIVSQVNNLIVQFKQDITNAPANMDEDEFPPCSEDYIESGNGPLYPDPKPTVSRLRPRTIEIPANSTIASFEITLFGQSFSRLPKAKAKVVLKIPNQADQAMSAKSALFGTFRCSRMHVLVRPNAGSVSAGTYHVTFVNCPTTAHEEEQDVGNVTVVQL